MTSFGVNDVKQVIRREPGEKRNQKRARSWLNSRAANTSAAMPLT